MNLINDDEKKQTIIFGPKVFLRLFFGTFFMISIFDGPMLKLFKVPPATKCTEFERKSKKKNTYIV